MSRLTHSSAGFIRSLQMTSARVLAFVEGRLDRPFFDRILQSACAQSAVEHRVFAMKELPGSTGGKANLISTFKDFRKRGLLACTAFGKSMVCLFFADKDCDDFTRKRLRSPHLIYTPTYDLEGYLFTCGDVHRALADACGITLQQSARLIPNPNMWLNGAASNWKDWIALCLVSQSRSVNCGCTFDRISQVNPDPLAGPDAAQIAAFRIRLATTLGISQQSLDAEVDAALLKVEASIRSGKPLLYFKGKWLSHVLQRHIEAQPRIPDANISGVGDRLGATLVAQVAQTPACGCSAAYLHSIQGLLALL